MDRIGLAVDTSAGAGSRPDEVAARGERLPWIDVARGMLIVLVVLYHVSLVYTVSLAPPGSDAERALEAVVAAMKPFRMPMFFLLSGLLARSVIAKPWPALLRRRVAFFAIVYSSWFVIQTIVQKATDAGRPPLRHPRWDATSDDGWAGVFLNGTIAPTYLWFLLALTLYFPLAKALRKFGAWPLIPAGVVYLVSVLGWPGVELNQLPAVCAFFFWFYLGVAGGGLVTAAVTRPSLIVVGIALGLVVGGQFAELMVGERTAVLLAVASVGAVVVGFAFARAVVRWIPVVARPFAALGRQTLPVYVIHMPVLWLIILVTALLGVATPLTSQWIAIVVDVAATVVVLALSLLAHRLLRRPAGWLFEPFSRRRVPRTCVDTASASSAAS